MADFPEITDMVFPAFLQTHVRLRPGLDLHDRASFDQYVKVAALYSRGIVVTDSDLNNNPVLHAAGESSDGVFWSAIESGFIRRAARLRPDDEIASQAQVAEGLKRSSPDRYERIPQDYLRRLSKAFDTGADGRHPVVWSLPGVTKIFGRKLLALLRDPHTRAGRSIGELHLIDEYERWATEKLRAGDFFGAADLETELKPAADRAAWAEVWKIALQAHGGNIPLTFGGDLAMLGLPEGDDRLIPAGPESTGDESRVEEILYGRANLAGTATEIELKIYEPSDPDPTQFSINHALLAELTLAQVEELRETADPGPLLASRFAAAGSAAKYAGRAEEVDGLALEYHERLMRAGLMLTKRAQRTAIKDGLRRGRMARGVSSGRSIELHVVAQLDAEREVDFVVQAVSPYPSLGPQVVMCDFQLLRRIMEPDLYDALHSSTDAYYWFFKRPDFRVIEALAATVPE